MSQELLTIGAFARRARISPKALRLYDRLGLLSPARVDEVSGYRYYRAEQVERARLVALLRQLDMPLARIGEVLGLPGPAAAEALAAYWADVEERHAGQRALTGYLRGRLAGRRADMYAKFEIKTVDVPEQFVISESRHALVHELPAFLDASLVRLEQAAREECGGVAGAPFVQYYAEISQESDGPAECCVPVNDPAAARDWAATRGTGTRGGTAKSVPGARLAYTRVTKAQVAYPQINEAYEAVEAWIKERGLTIAGPCREVYFADWCAAGPEDEVCDIAFPVEPHAG